MVCTCEAEGMVSARWSSSTPLGSPALVEYHIFRKCGLNVNGRLHGLLAALCKSDGFFFMWRHLRAHV